MFKTFATNAAALTQIIGERTPSREAALPVPVLLNFQAFSETDDVENGFSITLANAGGGGCYKGSTIDMLRAGPRSEVQAEEKRNADRGYSIKINKKSPYEHAEQTKRQLNVWHDGSRYEEQRSLRSKKFRPALRHALPRHPKVRSFHVKH